MEKVLEKPKPHPIIRLGLGEVLTRKPKDFKEEFPYNPHSAKSRALRARSRTKAKPRGTFCGKNERSERFPQNVSAYLKFF